MSTECYSDDYIERWGRLFVLRELHMQYGIRFETFLRHPHAYLHQIAMHAMPSGDYLPLLPRQRAVQARLDADVLETELEENARIAYRGIGFIEPLHHCCWPRRPRKRITAK